MSGIMKRISGTFNKVSGNKSNPDLKLFKQLGKGNYKSQAVWFLNAFWKDKGNVTEGTHPNFSQNPNLCEDVWKYCALCAKLDLKRGEDGNELDELQAHKLLEIIEKTLTVVEMRAAMRKVDMDFNRYVSLLEFLVYKFDVDWKFLANAKIEQGDGGAALKATQELWDTAQKQLEECSAKAEQLKIDEAEAKRAKEDAIQKKEAAIESEKVAKAAEEEALEAEDKAKKEEAEAVSEEANAREKAEAAITAANAARAAEKEAIDAEKEAIESDKKAKEDEAVAKKAEAEAAQKEEVFKIAEEKAQAAEDVQRAEEEKVAEIVAELKQEQDNYNAALEHTEKTANRLSIGIVKRGKAKNEFYQLKAQETTGLQTAKLNQEAALRRQQKATKIAAAARVAAQKARAPFEKATKAAVAAREHAEQAAKTAEENKVAAIAAREEAVRIAAEAVSAEEEAVSARTAAEKARQEATDAREIAEQKRVEAVAALKQAYDDRVSSEKAAAEAIETAATVEASRIAAEEAVESSVAAFKEAEASLAKVKEQYDGAGEGTFWWMDREMEEAKKFMSKKQIARMAKTKK